MKCPFDPNYIYQTIFRKPKHTPIKTKDVDGEPDLIHSVSLDTDAILTHVFRDCILDDCASYQNGRCVRN